MLRHMLSRILQRHFARGFSHRASSLLQRSTLGLAAMVGAYGIGQDDVIAQIHCDQPFYSCQPGCPGCEAFAEGTVVPGTLPGMEAMPPAPETGGVQPLQPSPYGAPGTGAAAPSPADMAGLPAGFGAPRTGQSAVPTMFGDFFGNGYNYAAFNNASVAVAGGDRRFKYAENNSPFLMNRTFFTYNHFHNAVIDVNGVDQAVDRYMFGIERVVTPVTSLELRVPLAGGLDAVQVLGSSDTEALEFGNMSLSFKRMLRRSRNTLLTGGLSVVFPTGPDAPIVTSDGTAVVFENESLHLQPFLAAYHSRRPRTFHLFITQWDFDATGSDVFVPSEFSGSVGIGSTAQPGDASELNDQTLWYIDYAYGVWLAQNPNARYVRGVASLIELHYTTALEDQEYGAFEGRELFVEDRRRDVLNITGGLFFQLGPLASLKVAASAPLRDGSDKMYDSEIGVQFIRVY